MLYHRLSIKFLKFNNIIFVFLFLFGLVFYFYFFSSLVLLLYNNNNNLYLNNNQLLDYYILFNDYHYLKDFFHKFINNCFDDNVSNQKIEL
jgi:hypothetical protein